MSRKRPPLLRRISRQLLTPVDQRAYEEFYNYPFGDKPKADAGRYREIWDKARTASYALIDEFERESGFAIDPEWFHELALLTQVVIKKSDICYQHGRVLYSALSAYIARTGLRDLTILETGTARGFSSLCMARALEDAGVSGKIITCDVLPHDTKMYWNCIADEDGPRSRAELLAGYQPLVEKYLVFLQGDTKRQLPKLGLPRIHFAFMDGAHTYKDVMNEFQFVQPRQQPGDIVCFDDYTKDFFPGIVRAVDEICERYAYSKRTIVVSPQRGYVVARKSGD